LKVIWYHRVDGESLIFRYAPELGDFLVPEIMLRAGAGSTKLSLEDVPGVGTRGASSKVELSKSLDEAIIYQIDHIYHDQEYEV
jgi:hypothetical protein